MILDDVLSSSQCSSFCWVSSISWIVVDIHGLVANEISCPWLLFIWVVSYHWWRRLPLNVKRYLINYPYLLIMGRQYFVFLFRQGTEQPHQGDVNNILSFLIHPRRYAIRTKWSRSTYYSFLLVWSLWRCSLILLSGLNSVVGVDVGNNCWRVLFIASRGWRIRAKSELVALLGGEEIDGSVSRNKETWTDEQSELGDLVSWFLVVLR